MGRVADRYPVRDGPFLREPRRYGLRISQQAPAGSAAVLPIHAPVVRLAVFSHCNLHRLFSSLSFFFPVELLSIDTYVNQKDFV